MVAETEFICQQSISMLDVKYHLCVTQEHNVKVDVSPTSPPTSSLPIFAHVSLFSYSLFQIQFIFFFFKIEIEIRTLVLFYLVKELVFP